MSAATAQISRSPGRAVSSPGTVTRHRLVIRVTPDGQAEVRRLTLVDQRTGQAGELIGTWPADELQTLLTAALA